MTTYFNPRKTPWRIDEGDFYEIDSRDEQLAFLVRYATLAPSSHNSQPWSFRITPEGIEVFADLSRRLPVADPADRELLMSVGAAMSNLRVAAAHFGFETTVLYGSQRDETSPVATIAIRETCAPSFELRRLFAAIPQRHTNRSSFEEKSIEPATLSALCDFMEEHAEYAQFVLPHDQSRIAELVAEGNRQLMANEEFRKETAQWVRANETTADDGICGDGFGIPGPLAALGPWMIRSFDLGPAQAAHDKELVEKAAGLIAITADDDRVSLLRAGETLELLLLLLTTAGVQYSFMNQPCEVEQLRRQLWSMLRSERPPQLLVRIGYARAVQRPMPRRDVGNVLVT